MAIPRLTVSSRSEQHHDASTAGQSDVNMSPSPTTGSPTTETSYMNGMGARGKPFIVATLIHVYLATAVLRALTISSWLVSKSPISIDTINATQVTAQPTPSSSLASEATHKIINNVATKVQLQFSPLMYMGSDISILVLISLVFTLIVQISFIVRLSEKIVKWSSAIAVIGCFMHGVLMTVAVVLFKTRIRRDVMEVAQISQGFLAALASAVCSLVVFALLMWDRIRNNGENEHIGKSRKKLIISAIIASWTISMGGLLFHAIEGFDYEDTYAFVLTTLLTIGYGNIAPQTTFGRVFLFFYFFVGIGSFALFFHAVEEHVAEKAKWQIEHAARVAYRRKQLNGVEGESAGSLVPRRTRRGRVVFKRWPKLASAFLVKGGIGDSEDTVYEDHEALTVVTFLKGVKTFWFNGCRIGETRVESSQVLEGSHATVIDMPKDTLTKRRRRKKDSEIVEVQKRAERNKMWMMIIFILIWWFLSAKIFEVCEIASNWTYMDALYFTFITMTTIGYGDLVPSSPWSWEFWNVFAFTGIATFAVFLALVQARYVSRFAKVAEKAERRVVRRRERKRGSRREEDRGVVGEVEGRVVAERKESCLCCEGGRIDDGRSAERILSRKQR